MFFVKQAADAKAGDKHARRRRSLARQVASPAQLFACMSQSFPACCLIVCSACFLIVCLVNLSRGEGRAAALFHPTLTSLSAPRTPLKAAKCVDSPRDMLDGPNLAVLTPIPFLSLYTHARHKYLSSGKDARAVCGCGIRPRYRHFPPRPHERHTRSTHISRIRSDRHT